jgi:hypothetical protein
MKEIQNPVSIPAELVDEVMPDLTQAEWSVLVWMIRHAFGQSERTVPGGKCRASVRAMQKATNVRTAQTIREALKNLQRYGLIRQDPEQEEGPFEARVWQITPDAVDKASLKGRGRLVNDGRRRHF